MYESSFYPIDRWLKLLSRVRAQGIISSCSTFN